MRTPGHPSQTIYWVIEPMLWSSTDNVRAQEEGWMLSHLGEIFRCRLPKSGWKFFDDQEAATYVQQRADDGSEFHLRAMIACTAAKLNPVNDAPKWSEPP